jgi:hypothetical protein
MPFEILNVDRDPAEDTRNPQAGHGMVSETLLTVSSFRASVPFACLASELTHFDHQSIEPF